MAGNCTASGADAMWASFTRGAFDDQLEGSRDQIVAATDFDPVCSGFQNDSFQLCLDLTSANGRKGNVVTPDKQFAFGVEDIHGRVERGYVKHDGVFVPLTRPTRGD